MFRIYLQYTSKFIPSTLLALTIRLGLRAMAFMLLRFCGFSYCSSGKSLTQSCLNLSRYFNFHMAAGMMLVRFPWILKHYNFGQLPIRSSIWGSVSLLWEISKVLSSDRVFSNEAGKTLRFLLRYDACLILIIFVSEGILGWGETSILREVFAFFKGLLG